MRRRAAIRSDHGLIYPAAGNERGFTMVELVVVAALLAVVSGLLFGTLRNIIGTKQAAEDLQGVNATA